ncbi:MULTISPECIES: TMEM199/VMA12 family vacuolar ATPase assembly factor [Paenochrobactrum]|nr:TMEM199/VMA12 family vacuolar ATPase assembly factor [Paenochrobactrum gallinarii]
MLSGNIISINGTAISGWYGVWSLTLALGIAGFLFGLIGALLVRAVGIAAEK